MYTNGGQRICIIYCKGLGKKHKSKFMEEAMKVQCKTLPVLAPMVSKPSCVLDLYLMPVR